MLTLQRLIAEPVNKDFAISLAIGGISGMIHKRTVGNVVIGSVVGGIEYLNRADLDQTSSEMRVIASVIASISITLIGFKIGHDMFLSPVTPLFSTSLQALVTLGTFNILGHLLLIYLPCLLTEKAPNDPKTLTKEELFYFYHHFDRLIFQEGNRSKTELIREFFNRDFHPNEKILKRYSPDGAELGPHHFGLNADGHLLKEPELFTRNQKGWLIGIYGQDISSSDPTDHPWRSLPISLQLFLKTEESSNFSNRKKVVAAISDESFLSHHLGTLSDQTLLKFTQYFDNHRDEWDSLDPSIQLVFQQSLKGRHIRLKFPTKTR
jgi:hypothetical protein